MMNGLALVIAPVMAILSVVATVYVARRFEADAKSERQHRELAAELADLTRSFAEYEESSATTESHATRIGFSKAEKRRAELIAKSQGRDADDELASALGALKVHAAEQVERGEYSTIQEAFKAYWLEQATKGSWTTEEINRRSRSRLQALSSVHSPRLVEALLRTGLLDTPKSVKDR